MLSHPYVPASTFFFPVIVKQDVDGRDKPDHDESFGDVCVEPPT